MEVEVGLKWNDVSVGSEIGRLQKGVISTAHIMRWCAAIENFHRIHYDLPFAMEHDRLPGIVVNGSWKQHILVQLVKDTLGESGWLWKLSFRYKAMDIAGDSITAVANLEEKKVINDLGFLLIKVCLINEKSGDTTTAGYAIGVLPVDDSHVVPYPFEPHPLYDQIQIPKIG